MKRFDISAKLETVRGFLDDPDTHQAVAVFDESTKGKWVDAADAISFANQRVMKAQEAMTEAHKTNTAEPVSYTHLTLPTTPYV